MYSHHNFSFKRLLTLVFLITFSLAASAQRPRIETKRVLKDSIATLLDRIDSLQKAYDEMVSAPFEEIALVSDEDGEEEEDDEDRMFDTDSALVAWYDNLSRHSQDDEELMEVGEMKYASEIPDEVYIERLNRINTSVKIPYNDVVRSYIIYYTQKMSKAKISRIVGLSSYYLPIFEEIFDQYGLPHFADEHVWPDAVMNESRGWEIYPQGLYDFGMDCAKNYPDLEWFVSENGIGIMDEYKNRDAEGAIQDDYRVDFVRQHLEWVAKAISEGAKCRGYHYWAVIDNWSWSNAFKNRYGFVEVDLMDGYKRRLKKSAAWLKQVATTHVVD